MSPSDPEPYILVIDDELTIRTSMRRLLQSQGYQVALAEDGLVGLQLVEQLPIAVALVDRNLPDILGEELIPEILDISPTTLCIAMTGQSTAQAGKRMLEAGAADYFVKPITALDLFFERIERHLQRRKELVDQQLRIRAQLLHEHRAESQLDGLKGNSPAMQEMLEEIRALAPLPVPVLIRGESGTGKELVAIAVHDLSRNPEGPFVPVNCAAIPHDLFESELFGHVVGAFTNAVKDNAGLCSEAAGGTLFLDEVGELPLELQAKLLRVLEQRTFRKVGSAQSEKLLARVVAATNVDLEQAINDGRFREDLYFRLSAQEIYVPSLRDRSEDIHQLAFHFIDRYNAEFGRHVQRIHPEALQKLLDHVWSRNNVRELDREIQRALARCGPGDEELAPAMLFRVRHQRRPRPSPVVSTPAQDFTKGLLEMPYKEAIKTGRDRIARWYLEHYLREADGNQTRAARLAHNMQRTHLSRLIRELGASTSDES